MEKLKVKPLADQDFKEIEVATKNWNLETRKTVNRLITAALSDSDKTTMFDACCEIVNIATTLSEDDVFDLSTDEIQSIGLRIADEINKKK
tara:strand:+ start:1832 stop:2104 length:273 start_codon:yes stop_codon:yes gene_type:complete